LLDLFFTLTSLFLLSVPLALVAVFALSAPFGAAMGYFVTEGPNGLTGFFQPDRGLNLGWPIGVQEEDAPGWKWQRRDQPTGADVSGIPLADSRPNSVPHARSSTTPPGMTRYGIAPTRIDRVRVRFVRRHTS
jgi:hypothetical protein